MAEQMSDTEIVAKARELADKSTMSQWDAWDYSREARVSISELCDIIDRLREENAEMLEIIRRRPRTGLDEINSELRSQLMMVMSERDVAQLRIDELTEERDEARALLAEINEAREDFDNS